MQSVAPNQAVFGGLSFTRVDEAHLRIELRLRESDGTENTEVFEFQNRPL